MIWIKLEDISFLVINSMISISIPGIASIILAVMIKYINFEILYTELWVYQFFTGIKIEFSEI